MCSQGNISCEFLAIRTKDDEINRFVNLGHIKDSTHVFECGTVVNGEHEINAFINSDGSCSFINSDATTFTSLADVPHHFKDKGNCIVVVGEDENCLRFSDNITVHNLVAKAIRTDSINVEDLEINRDVKAETLRCTNVIQTGDGINLFSAPIQCAKVTTQDLHSYNFEGNTGNIATDLNVKGNTQTGTLNSNGIFNTGVAHLDEIKASVIECEVIECDARAHVGCAEIAGKLWVGGESEMKNVFSSNIVNHEKIETAIIKSTHGEILNLTASTLIVKNLINPSQLVLGTKEKPVIFIPNEKRYVDVEFEMPGLKAYCFGFAPTHCLDTICLKLKTTRVLEENAVQINFHYYNVKNSTPLIYKIGEIVYPCDGGIMCVLKLSGNLPVAPYWVLSAELLPF